MRILTFLLIITLFSCEDVIDVDLDNGKSQLTVDAVLNNSQEMQTIRLTNSGDYFDPNSVTPALGAEVILTDNNGNQYNFLDTANSGYYTYFNNNNWEVGTKFTLNIKYKDLSFISESVLNRNTKIDSITWKRENFPFSGIDSFLTVQFWATDNIGLGDTYWIRALRNGKLNYSPTSITVAYDGAPGRGSKADGIPFIAPLRFSITPDLGENGKDTLTYGESVGVELLAISKEFAEYLVVLGQQLNNAGLFAVPPTNLPTNIKNIDPNGEEALGWFEVTNKVKFSAILSDTTNIVKNE